MFFYFSILCSMYLPLPPSLAARSRHSTPCVKKFALHFPLKLCLSHLMPPTLGVTQSDQSTYYPAHPWSAGGKLNSAGITIWGEGDGTNSSDSAAVTSRDEWARPKCPSCRTTLWYPEETNPWSCEVPSIPALPICTQQTLSNKKDEGRIYSCDDKQNSQNTDRNFHAVISR